MNDLTTAARRYRRAQRSYLAAFRQHLDNQVTALPEPRFWQLQAVFTLEVCRFRFDYGRTNGIEHAANEFFRKPLAQDFSGWGGPAAPSYSLPEAIQFAKTWQLLSKRLYRPLFDVVTDRGDDAYGDLLDALPLAGQCVVAQALAGGFTSNQQFEDGVRSACAAYPDLAELILRGENYVGQMLYEAAQEATSTVPLPA